MEAWELDFDKCIEFGLDETSTMIGKQNGIAAHLKKKINIFLTSIHCVAHKNKFRSYRCNKYWTLQRHV